jgi:hypothetical protein
MGSITIIINISEGSQSHQPPQFPSWKAHQPPKNNESINNLKIIKILL